MLVTYLAAMAFSPLGQGWHLFAHLLLEHPGAFSAGHRMEGATHSEHLAVAATKRIRGHQHAEGDEQSHRGEESRAYVSSQSPQDCDEDARRRERERQHDKAHRLGIEHGHLHASEPVVCRENRPAVAGSRSEQVTSVNASASNVPHKHGGIVHTHEHEDPNPQLVTIVPPDKHFASGGPCVDADFGRRFGRLLVADSIPPQHALPIDTPPPRRWI